jgi:hypothetical protein
MGIGRDLSLEQSVTLAASLFGGTKTNNSEHLVDLRLRLVTVELYDRELGSIDRAVESQEHEVIYVQRRVIFGMLTLLCTRRVMPLNCTGLNRHERYRCLDQHNEQQYGLCWVRSRIHRTQHPSWQRIVLSASCGSASNDSTLDRFDQFFCMIPVTATTHAPDAIHGTKALQRMSTDLGVVSCLPTGLGMLGIGAFDTAFWIVDPTNVAPSKRCRHHDEDGEE